MGSVQSEIKCPHCGGVMVCDYYYKTDEEYKMCPRCGFSESWTLVRDDKGKVILNKKGKAVYKHKKSRGYGCACIAGRKGVSQLCMLEKPLTRKQKIEFKEILNEQDVDASRCYLTQRKPFSKRVTSIYGELPELYDDYLKITGD